ncbi:MFS transporter, partial [Streptomyces sp. MCAF7]
INGGGTTTPTHAGPFADTYLWAVALMLAAVLPALLLPRRRPTAPAAANAPTEERAPQRT